MVPEAPMEGGPGGKKAAGEGWFIVNAREAEWIHNEKFGAGVVFESEAAGFDHYGINIQVMWPGQPNCYYHAEEGQERPLKAWDFVHCPPWTEHVFVGSGDGPCAIVGVGARNAGEGLRYPVSDVALRHGAGVQEEATTGKVAYADAPESTQGPYVEGLPDH